MICQLAKTKLCLFTPDSQTSIIINDMLVQGHNSYQPLALDWWGSFGNIDYKLSILLKAIVSWAMEIQLHESKIKGLLFQMTHWGLFRVHQYV